MLELAYIPFLQPLPTVANWWWLLLIPCCAGVSVTWKAVRLESLEHFWREAVTMTAHSILVMAALAAGLMVLLRVVIPLLPSS
ncbi:MAG: hypothetical protein K8R92_06530 [Planctomycetes bacterium]|nr:hypothetical protein [Planctomycetota bacterium]